ncbi:MAG: ATP-binding protein [Desulfuromonadales bacterium]
MARTKFPAEFQPSQQRLLAMRITRLKNLIDVEIEFDENRPLTAIRGPNGFGKSSILHALAASFSRPVSSSVEDHRYVDFFPNTPHGVWSGTDFVISHKYRLGPDVHNQAPHIRKETGQWLPLPKKRPVREVHFVGVRSAVPKIETQETRRRIKYATNDLTDENSKEIREKTGIVFNRLHKISF